MHLAQAKNYVVDYDFPIGLLINFGNTSLQFKKVFNKKYQDNQNPDSDKWFKLKIWYFIFTQNRLTENINFYNSNCNQK